jgi:hypothetical protein
MRASLRDCRAYGKENETTPSATTLGVVKIAPHMSVSNKLGMNQSVNREYGHSLRHNSWQEVDL